MLNRSTKDFKKDRTKDGFDVNYSEAADSRGAGRGLELVLRRRGRVRRPRTARHEQRGPGRERRRGPAGRRLRRPADDCDRRMRKLRGRAAMAAETDVYLRAPGTVVRCRSCGSALMVFVTVRGTTSSTCAVLPVLGA